MKIPIIRAFGLFLLAATAVLHAQVPQLINYQGRIAVGTPAVNFDGTGAFKFALVDAAGTTTYWSNDGTSAEGSQPEAAVVLTVTKGLYSVLLGDTELENMKQAIPNSVFANADVRLRVWFNDDRNGSQLLKPDQRIAAVGYALMADSVQDGAITSAKIADGAVGAAQLAANAVQSGNIAAGAVASAQLAPNLTVSGTLIAGNLQGDGSGLTNIPASAVVPAPPGMVLIPAGAFTMGNSVAADTDITDAVPVSVTLSAYYLAVNEVSLSQWQAVYYWATSHGYTFMDSTTWPGMSWSGVGTGMERRTREASTRADRLRVRTGCSGAAIGSASRTTAVSRTAATSRAATATS